MLKILLKFTIFVRLFSTTISESASTLFLCCKTKSYNDNKLTFSCLWGFLSFNSMPEANSPTVAEVIPMWQRCLSITSFHFLTPNVPEVSTVQKHFWTNMKGMCKIRQDTHLLWTKQKPKRSRFDWQLAFVVQWFLSVSRLIS